MENIFSWRTIFMLKEYQRNPRVPSGFSVRFILQHHCPISCITVSAHYKEPYKDFLLLISQ